MRYRHNFIINSTQASLMDNYSQNIEKSTNEEMGIPEKQIGDFKQMFQKQSLQKKKHYLSALRQHNRTLMEKIKDFNQKVSAEVNSLAKKIVPKKKSIITKLQQIQTKALRQKFQELEKYKKQVDTKRSSTDSLQFLLTVKQKFEIKLNQLAKEVSDKKKQIQKLKIIKEKSTITEEKDRKQLQKLGEMDIYSPQIEQLRMRVREKSDSLRVKKQQFLSLYKQNKSNKSIMVQKSPKEQEIKQEDPELIKLKQYYQSLGKRVQILKLKKSNLSNQIKADSEGVKKLQKLKVKYQSLTIVPS